MHHIIKTSALFTSLLLLFSCQVSSQNQEEAIQKNKQSKTQWVDSVMQTMNNDQKIGQLFMAQVYADNRHPKNIKETIQLITNYDIGGIIFMQSEPWYVKQAVIDFQKKSKIPILMATDAEWGLAMRMKGHTLAYPYQMALGAVQNDSLLYQMGKEIAIQLKEIGINFNFAPVVDVNNNPNNPVISYRSFGENPKLVAKKAIQYMNGMQEESLIVTAKHFPGHGDTSVDSHVGLPVVNHSKSRLNKIELAPFKAIIDAGVSGVMIAHLSVPALDHRPNIPSTLSKPIIDSLLQKTMHFKGLIVSDAMNMGALTKNFPIGEADVRAIEAGMDIIEITTDIPKAIQAVKAAIKSKRFTMKRIEHSCRKILAAKYDAGLAQKLNLKNEDSKALSKSLNKSSYKATIHQLAQQSLTVLKNEASTVPIKNLQEKIAIVSFNREGSKSIFQEIGKKYVPNAVVYSLPAKATATQIANLKKQLASVKTIIIGMHQVNKRPGNYSGYSDEVKAFIASKKENKKQIIAYFRNPYTLNRFPKFENTQTLILAYQGDEVFQSAAMQLIMGGAGANGKLPVTINENYPFGHGLEIKSLNRLQYGYPEEVGMNGQLLKKKIDALMQEALEAKATPGGVILIAKNNQIIFEEAYGTKLFSDTTKVCVNDIYDLASITKVTAALPALMKLQGEGKFELDKPLDFYLPYFKGSNKGDKTMKDILGHQAGLYPWIPFYQYTIKGSKNGKGKRKLTKKTNGKYVCKTFSNKVSKKYPTAITQSLYLHKDFEKKIYRSIRDIENLPNNNYKYSGLSFYLWPKIIEYLSGTDFVSYLNENFYKPLGAFTLGFNPLERFEKAVIVPTEYDMFFRNELLHGKVHDEGAAVMNGVSSNAGLFSTANDLAKLLQMYLNGGNYGGKQYIDQGVLKQYTSYQFKENNNRRGLGFDKPQFKYNPNGNASKYASSESYGHTGYTGTRFWIDPREELIYIFLSNRVSPTRQNTRLYRLNTRTEIERVIYESMM